MSRVMTNGNNVPYNLVTYHGPDDLRTCTMQQVQTDILAQTLQDSPYDLQPASFNLAMARTDGIALRSEIEGNFLKLAYPTICNTLFLELCPGYSNQSHAILDHIRQVHYDRDGNQVISTVQAYFQQVMNPHQRLPKVPRWLRPSIYRGYSPILPGLQCRSSTCLNAPEEDTSEDASSSSAG